MKIQAVPDWALAAGLIGLGGAAIYLWSRGARGVASDVTGTVGNIAAGVVDGLGGAASNVFTATGNAFQDVTQAALGVPKTNADQCAADLASGSTLAASFSCPAGTWLRSLFTSTPAITVQKTTQPLTAPGGGVVDQTTFFSILDGPNDGSCVATFDNPTPCPATGTGTGWLMNWAPANPVPYTRPAVVPVAGLRG